MDYFYRNTLIDYAEDQGDLSYAYFCPKCGEIWARIVLSRPARYFALHSGCDRCGPAWPEEDADFACFTKPYAVVRFLPLSILIAPAGVLRHDFNQLKRRYHANAD